MTRFISSKIVEQPRKARFEDPKFKSQKILSRLEDLKLEGLKQIAIQMFTNFEKKKMRKGDWIKLLDPKLRSLEKNFHLVVDEKKIRLCNDEIASNNNEKRNEIENICRKELKATMWTKPAWKLKKIYLRP